jgi:hypothetical protein
MFWRMGQIYIVIIRYEENTIFIEINITVPGEECNSNAS